MVIVRDQLIRGVFFCLVCLLLSLTGCQELTIELSYRKWPDAGDLPGFWKANKKSLFGSSRQVSFRTQRSPRRHYVSQITLI
jgi:hypothetical protein